MSGKGSSPRPYSVDRPTFEDNWDKIFGKKAEERSDKSIDDDDDDLLGDIRDELDQTPGL